MASKISTRLIVVIGFAILLAGAFFAPEFLFRIQDKKVETQTDVSSMEGLGANITKLRYESDDVKRLEDFARGLSEDRNYYCMEDGSFAPTEAEVADIVRRATATASNQWIDYCYSIYETVVDYYGFSWWEMIPWQQDREAAVRRFLVYDEEFLGGVAFHLYFVELKGYVDTLRVVMDAETDMIYYVELELTERGTTGYYETDKGGKIPLFSAGNYWTLLAEPYVYFYEEFEQPGVFNENQFELKSYHYSVIDTYFCKAGNSSLLQVLAEDHWKEKMEQKDIKVKNQTVDVQIYDGEPAGQASGKSGSDGGGCLPPKKRLTPSRSSWQGRDRRINCWNQRSLIFTRTLALRSGCPCCTTSQTG